jgi:hypothetical protein
MKKDKKKEKKKERRKWTIEAGRTGKVGQKAVVTQLTTHPHTVSSMKVNETWRGG